MAASNSNHSADAVTFLFGAGTLSLDLARTLSERHTTSWERLATPADLSSWMSEVGITLRLPEQAIGQDGLQRARGLREAVYAVVHAHAHNQKPNTASVAALNRYAQAPPPVPQLGSLSACTWTAREPLSAVLSLIARDAIGLASSPLASRLRECVDEDCTSIFLDTSRGQRRRWCSMQRCGNRAKKRTFRTRRQRKPGSAV